MQAFFHGGSPPAGGRRDCPLFLKRFSLTARWTDAHALHPDLIMLFPAHLNALHILYRDYGLEPLRTYPPASAADLAAAEAALGFALDPALKATWQSANGSDEWQTVFARPGYITGYSFLSLADSLREREYMAHRTPQYDGYEQEQPRDPRICSGWYQAGWLPFAAFSAPRSAADC